MFRRPTHPLTLGMAAAHARQIVHLGLGRERAGTFADLDPHDAIVARDRDHVGPRQQAALQPLATQPDRRRLGEAGPRDGVTAAVPGDDVDARGQAALLAENGGLKHLQHVFAFAQAFEPDREVFAGLVVDLELDDAAADDRGERWWPASRTSCSS